MLAPIDFDDFIHDKKELEKIEKINRIVYIIMFALMFLVVFFLLFSLLFT